MRIVVVEDEAPIREGMSKLLGKLSENYELVGKAENGKKGLELIREELPDLVFMDIQMPEMDGLTMLSHVREEGISCKVVILSAYSDFSYAQKAIELGVENYLLKPVKISELKKILSQIEEELVRESRKKEGVDLEYIFLDAITGRLKINKKLEASIQEKYGIKKDEELVIFAIGLDGNFAQYHAIVKRMLETLAMRNKAFQAHISEFPSRAAVVIILWGLEDEIRVQKFFQTRVIPVLSNQVKSNVVYMWQKCNGLLNVRSAIMEMDREGKWNLLFEKGKMISKQAIAERPIAPFKYPTQIEMKASAALLDGNEDEFMRTINMLKQYCLTNPCTPEDVQGVLTRGYLRFMHVARETGKMKANVSAQPMINELSKIKDWDEIAKLFQTFFEGLTLKNEDEKRSAMIQKAILYIKQYYSQGITLEEIAEKLHVSEEYLSAQFRKETGKTFSETIKQYRLAHIKELLINSSLKLNQIADMVGYSDAKYMSKVFKEEVGMLPTEYRKQNT